MIIKETKVNAGDQLYNENQAHPPYKTLCILKLRTMSMIYNVQKEQTCWKPVTPLSVRPATTAHPSIGKPFPCSNRYFFSSMNFPRHLSTMLQTTKRTKVQEYVQIN